MSKTIRIGSRDSALATWQAKEVQGLLKAQGVPSEIVFIKSIGDLIQDKALSSIGVVGVFTKALDDALLDNQIDIAVHSCKDLPSQINEELTLAAYLEREDPSDLLVSNKPIDFLTDTNFSGIIATGSVRRKAQLLAKFPKAEIVDLRGNVPTRLKKLEDSSWSAAVFASAGLKRLGIHPRHVAVADFMVPAPAQGIVAIACRKNDQEIIELCQSINHEASSIAAQTEREFLRLMEGGCISPIGAFAQIIEGQISLSISVLSTDGKEQIQIREEEHITNWQKLSNKTFQEAVRLGAKQLIEQIEQNASSSHH